jgi:hypothetical protein
LGRDGDNALRKLKSWKYSVQRVRCRIDKNLWYVEAQLWVATHAMVRLGQGGD